MALPPLSFEPIFKSMLWGGRRLPRFLGCAEPHNDPIGEAWLLSDVDGNYSRVAEGPLAGATLREIIADHAEELFGRSMPSDGRFPLLLKFIDARQELSVQVHPNDAQAIELVGAGRRGKTEAWVILDANRETSRIYAGFQNGICEAEFRQALSEGRTPHTLHHFIPEPGDCVFLQAGTVHAIGADVMLFEVQQTSDITYRLYDWDRLDAKTGQPRELHIEHGLICSNFAAGPCQPIKPRGEDLQSLVESEFFHLHRQTIRKPVTVEANDQCRVIVIVDGEGEMVHGGIRNHLRPGRVFLLPASSGVGVMTPRSSTLTMLECRLPE